MGFFRSLRCDRAYIGVWDLRALYMCLVFSFCCTVDFRCHQARQQGNRSSQAFTRGFEQLWDIRVIGKQNNPLGMQNRSRKQSNVQQNVWTCPDNSGMLTETSWKLQKCPVHVRAKSTTVGIPWIDLGFYFLVCLPFVCVHRSNRRHVTNPHKKIMVMKRTTLGHVGGDFVKGCLRKMWSAFRGMNIVRKHTQNK